MAATRAKDANDSTRSICHRMSISHSLSMIVLTLLGLLAGGSLLNLSNHPHWFVRGWDFPRVQIVLIAWVLVAAYFVIRYVSENEGSPTARPYLIIAILLTAWHGFRIAPRYGRDVLCQVKLAKRNPAATSD
jgi:hypothetical protein